MQKQTIQIGCSKSHDYFNQSESIISALCTAKICLWQIGSRSKDEIKIDDGIDWEYFKNGFQNHDWTIFDFGRSKQSARGRSQISQSYKHVLQS